jgi:hypothetical protein
MLFCNIIGLISPLVARIRAENKIRPLHPPIIVVDTSIALMFLNGNLRIIDCNLHTWSEIFFRRLQEVLLFFAKSCRSQGQFETFTNLHSKTILNGYDYGLKDAPLGRRDLIMTSGRYQEEMRQCVADQILTLTP